VLKIYQQLIDQLKVGKDKKALATNIDFFSIGVFPYFQYSSNTVKLRL